MGELELYTTWFYFASEAAAMSAAAELGARRYATRTLPPRTVWTVGGVELWPPATFASEGAASAAVAELEREGKLVWLVEPDYYWLVEGLTPRDWDDDAVGWEAVFAESHGALSYGGEMGWLDRASGRWVGDEMTLAALAELERERRRRR